MFEVYNDLVWVTLCRLQGPLNLSFRGAGAYNRLTRPAPPKGAIGDTAAARTHKGGGHPHCTSRTSSRWTSANCPAHVTASVPHGGVRRLKLLPSLRYATQMVWRSVRRVAGERRMGQVSVALKFYRVRGQGSIPQPHQELPAVNPLPFHVPIVGGEVREARVHGGRLQSDVPGDGVVGGVRAIPEDV